MPKWHPMAKTRRADLQRALDDFIEKHGTQRAAAAALGCSPPFLSRVRRGERSFPRRDADRWARLLGLSKEAFLLARYEEAS